MQYWQTPLPKRGITPQAIFKIQIGMLQGVPGPHPHVKFHCCGLKIVGLQPLRSWKMVIFNTNLPLISDRTDLSTESSSGPIQLALDRYRAARRSVADSPPHCMNAQKIVSYYTQSHTRRKESGETEHSVHGAEAESPSISTCHVAAHASGLGERDHRRHYVVGQCVPSSDRHGLYVECGRLYNIYYTDVHATGPGYPLCRRLAAV